MFKPLLVAAALALLSSGTAPLQAAPQTTGFTYQGELKHQGVPFSGLVDLEFRLWDAPVAGNAIAAAVTQDDVPVQDGIFTVQIDFGQVFGTEQRWIEVVANGTPLLPRQPVTSSPVALYALSGNPGPTGPAGTTGQFGNTVLSTGQLVLTAATNSYTLIPGLTQTISVPTNAKVFVSTDGGLQNASNGTTYGVADIAIFLDGSASTIQRQVVVSNTPALGQIISQWSLSGVFELAPGTHTIQVRAKDGGGTSDVNVSGTNPLIRGNLSVLILKH
ncbi:hypothetical protein OS187_08625 [Xanthomonadaceae bacterium JHOS43]|jgi:hypothetical protein|nr:hypothetical protein [Xanthomonadaceae bacterium JHOS43]MCX7564010.1 hypothetical protein [Xanthomonadaceae bacterium XH05]